MDMCTPVYYNKFDLSWKFEPYEIWNIYEDAPYGHSLVRSTDFNLYIFRYAQILLTYAEAKARSGQPDDKAYEAVNRVRRRAHKVDIYSPSVYDITPGLTPELFADSVVWERAWELCAEPEGRWFDLVRLEMVEDLTSLRNPDEMLDYPEMIDKNYYFSAIPESDLK